MKRHRTNFMVIFVYDLQHHYYPNCQYLPEVKKTTDGHSDEERFNEGGEVDQHEHVRGSQHRQRDHTLEHGPCQSLRVSDSVQRRKERAGGYALSTKIFLIIIFGQIYFSLNQKLKKKH